MAQAFYPWKFGFVKISYEQDFLKSIDIVSEISGEHTSSPISEQVYQQLLEYIAGKRKIFDIAYKIKGTPFQEKVWQALQKIPYGETRSYKEIAIEIGHPNAFRAVGSANNKNPLTIIIPCHRVIGSSGAMVGYAHGLDMKNYLLDLEKKNIL